MEDHLLQHHHAETCLTRILNVTFHAWTENQNSHQVSVHNERVPFNRNCAITRFDYFDRSLNAKTRFLGKPGLGELVEDLEGDSSAESPAATTADRSGNQAPANLLRGGLGGWLPGTARRRLRRHHLVGN